MKHANKLAGFEFKLILHARLEFELHTMNIVRATGDRNSSSSHNLSSTGSRSSRALYRSVAVRRLAFGPLVAFFGDNGGITERVLCGLGCGGARGQVGEELSDRAEAEAWCGGGSLSTGAAESVAVAAEPVDRCWSCGEPVLLVELFKTALALLATPAEEDQTEDKSKTKDNSHCEASLCATGHTSLLGFSNSAVRGAERSASNHARRGVGSLCAVRVSYLSSLDGGRCDFRRRRRRGWLAGRHDSLLSST